MPGGWYLPVGDTGRLLLGLGVEEEGPDGAPQGVRDPLHNKFGKSSRPTACPLIFA